MCCISKVWKTRLWSLSSVWTRAVQLEDESNQHLALVPRGKWGRVEDLKGNGGLGLLADVLVHKRWGSSNTVFVGCLGMKSERIVSWLMKFSGSNSFRAAPAFHPERMKMVLWWNKLKTEAIEFKEHLHQLALFSISLPFLARRIFDTSNLTFTSMIFEYSRLVGYGWTVRKKEESLEKPNLEDFKPLSINPWSFPQFAPEKMVVSKESDFLQLWLFFPIWEDWVLVTNFRGCLSCCNFRCCEVPLMDFINHWIPSEGSTEQLGGGGWLGEYFCKGTCLEMLVAK